jgi:hypothetical protein
VKDHRLRDDGSIRPVDEEEEFEEQSFQILCKQLRSSDFGQESQSGQPDVRWRPKSISLARGTWMANKPCLRQNTAADLARGRPLLFLRRRVKEAFFGELDRRKIV